MLGQTTGDKVVRFKSNRSKDEFAKALRMAIARYFKENNISRYGNREMHLKTVFAAVTWLAVWALIMSNILSEYPLAVLAAFTLLGYVNIFIAFNIAHDACHDAYSKNPKINKIMGYSLNFVGGNSYLFRMMHNAHHQYVNIHGTDVTLETHGLFRFTPDEPWKPVHRFQHIYTPVLYALAGIHWAIVKDFKWFFGEAHIGNNKYIKHPKSEYVALFVGKIVHFGLHLILPMIFLNLAWYWVIIGYFCLHFLPGLTFALMFQVTHIFDGTHYPIPDEEGNIDNNYAIHVLETTADFSRRSRVGSWLMGGINIHVIHHIMPSICHVHYPAVTKILIDVANDYGIEYNENRTFWQALSKHMRLLHHLSRPNAKVARYREKEVVLN